MDGRAVKSGSDKKKKRYSAGRVGGKAGGRISARKSMIAGYVFEVTSEDIIALDVGHVSQYLSLQHDELNCVFNKGAE
jgi:hypothetical protein